VERAKEERAKETTAAAVRAAKARCVHAVVFRERKFMKDDNQIQLTICFHPNFFRFNISFQKQKSDSSDDGKGRRRLRVHRVD
jgi:hypothetical protein